VSASDLAFGGTAVIVGGCALYKIRQVRRGSAAAGASYALVSCLVTLTTALTLQLHAVDHVVDQILGRGLASNAIGPALAIIGGCGYQCFVIIINDPLAAGPRCRLRVVLAAATVVVLVSLVAADPAGRAGPGEGQYYADHPTGVLTQTGYDMYMAFAAYDIARLAIRFTRLGDRPLLRLGLLMVSAGAAVGGVYAAVQLVFVVLTLILHRNLLAIETQVAHPLVILAALLASIGSTLPSWGRRLRMQRPADWLSLYVSYLTLYPLWRSLYEAAPQIALHPGPRWADRLPPGNVRYRLTRRVIEIRDGLLLLRPYRSPDAADEARALARGHGLKGLELSATVEAAEIAMALRARRAAAAPATATTGFSESAPRLGPAPRIADEISWLARVTYAFHRSPVVRLARHDAGTAPRPRFRTSA
jgi:hypothetical protein